MGKEPFLRSPLVLNGAVLHLFRRALSRPCLLVFQLVWSEGWQSAFLSKSWDPGLSQAGRNKIGLVRMFGPVCPRLSFHFTSFKAGGFQ